MAEQNGHFDMNVCRLLHTGDSPVSTAFSRVPSSFGWRIFHFVNGNDSKSFISLIFSITMSFPLYDGTNTWQIESNRQSKKWIIHDDFPFMPCRRRHFADDFIFSVSLSVGICFDLLLFVDGTFQRECAGYQSHGSNSNRHWYVSIVWMHPTPVSARIERERAMEKTLQSS